MVDILVTGCSGGGKSTLLEELELRGHAVVREPGRRLIAAGITPWADMSGFLAAAVDMARADLGWHAASTGPVFYDRGLIDALAGLERLGGDAVGTVLGNERPYSGGVFLAPPWPDLFAQDEARRHSLAEAISEYEHLASLLPVLGYRPIELPRAPVAERADFILDALDA
ncbi:AAA family ATPase [Qipengyuania sp. XHP0207]|uniref:AAA family ATPase n=1 Tax=Qipengyuania sp. XHP0207 TaxID=3038078 RepID=UPI00241EA3EB|nr:AAA family ATPase [Qipengyuania sp. XHP0207]MDG5747916.1 AAA family ATPase [Qipengyuania sp. XHP0207]